MKKEIKPFIKPEKDILRKENIKLVIAIVIIILCVVLSFYLRK